MLDVTNCWNLIAVARKFHNQMLCILIVFHDHVWKGWWFSPSLSNLVHQHYSFYSWATPVGQSSQYTSSLLKSVFAWLEPLLVLGYKNTWGYFTLVKQVILWSLSRCICIAWMLASHNIRRLCLTVGGIGVHPGCQAPSSLPLIFETSRNQSFWTTNNYGGWWINRMICYLNSDVSLCMITWARAFKWSYYRTACYLLAFQCCSQTKNGSAIVPSIRSK